MSNIKDLPCSSHLIWWMHELYFNLLIMHGGTPTCSEMFTYIYHCFVYIHFGTVERAVISNDILILSRASHVSRRWRSIIRYMDLKSGRRTSRFLRKIKKLYGIEKVCNVYFGGIFTIFFVPKDCHWEWAFYG